jgi:ribosome-associated protein
MVGEDREGDLLLAGGNRIPASELVEQASRSGGPGGQHVNTSSTRVTLRWNLRETRGLRPEARARALARLATRLTRSGELVLHADSHRSRRRNQQDARERLQAMVAEALVVEKPRRATKPTRASRGRRLDAKRRRGESKQLRTGRTDED